MASSHPLLPPAPVTLGLAPSFGFGDRIGLATPGHVAAMRRRGSGIQPIFAQQSIREMTRTGRTPAQVMADALAALAAAGWHSPHGADADHLKRAADVDATAPAGFTLFTIDPSEHVDQQADSYDASRLYERFLEERGTVPWLDAYRGREVRLSTGSTIAFDEPTLQRAAVKYGRAIEAAIALADHVRQRQSAAGADYEIELSVDETEQPTTLAEHWIVAEQCLERGVKLVALATRLPGAFEKGVDYLGDLPALERSLADHAAIARQVGPYKLSLHSGSDKLSIYRPLARATEGRFHVKTAGTSYLEALRVAARCEPELFADVVRCARGRYERDRATYHVHAELAAVPDAAALGDDPHRLEQTYLERWSDVPAGRGFTAAGRQILHCTFGSVLSDSRLGDALRQCLRQHADAYRELLADHFERHLNALQG